MAYIAKISQEGKPCEAGRNGTTLTKNMPGWLAMIVARSPTPGTQAGFPRRSPWMRRLRVTPVCNGNADFGPGAAPVGPATSARPTGGRPSSMQAELARQRLMAFHERKPVGDPASRGLLRLRAIFGVEQPRAEGLVEFGGDEIEPGLQLDALMRPGTRRKPARGPARLVTIQVMPFPSFRRWRDPLRARERASRSTEPARYGGPPPERPPAGRARRSARRPPR